MFVSARRLRWLPLASLSLVLPLGAQTSAGYFQDATIVGSTNSISITNLPVTEGGKTYYWNLTLPFDVGSLGHVMTGVLQEAPAEIFVDSAFMAGTYDGPSTIYAGSMKIALEGPSVWNKSYTEWTIRATTGANYCTYPNTGAFYVVPTLTANPIYNTRLKPAGITSSGWYYGTASSTSNCSPYYNWPANGIIGVNQVGKTVTIYSFSSIVNGKLVDHNSHVDQITYGLESK